MHRDAVAGSQLSWDSDMPTIQCLRRRRLKLRSRCSELHPSSVGTARTTRRTLRAAQACAAGPATRMRLGVSHASGSALRWRDGDRVVRVRRDAYRRRACFTALSRPTRRWRIRLAIKRCSRALHGHDAPDWQSKTTRADSCPSAMRVFDGGFCDAPWHTRWKFADPRIRLKHERTLTADACARMYVTYRDLHPRTYTPVQLRNVRASQRYPPRIRLSRITLPCPQEVRAPACRERRPSP